MELGAKEVAGAIKSSGLIQVRTLI